MTDPLSPERIREAIEYTEENLSSNSLLRRRFGDMFTQLVEKHETILAALEQVLGVRSYEKELRKYTPDALLDTERKKTMDKLEDQKTRIGFCVDKEVPCEF